MAIDIWNQCQVACKIVKLIDPVEKPIKQRQPSVKGWQTKLWREVELLKHISHVKPIIILWVLLTLCIAKYRYGEASLLYRTESVRLLSILP